MSIMDKIRAIMKQKGVTQQQLAKKLGVSESTVSKWEAGINNGYTRRIYEIADILGTTPEYLTGRNDYPMSSPEVEIPMLRRIIDVMKDKGITQRDLTKRLGLSENAFGSWKRGNNTGFERRLYEIADVLGVSVEYLRGEEEQQNNVESIRLTGEEIALINAYRKRKDMQSAVKTLLGVEDIGTTANNYSKISPLPLPATEALKK